MLIDFINIENKIAVFRPGELEYNSLKKAEVLEGPHWAPSPAHSLYGGENRRQVTSGDSLSSPEMLARQTLDQGSGLMTPNGHFWMKNIMCKY